MSCNQKISPSHYRHDYTGDPTLDDKIDLFQDRIKGWSLDVARDLADSDNTGFACLMTVTAYFETLARFKVGDCTDKQVGARFRTGLGWVFPGEFTDQQANLIYKELRCGLYHTGIAGSVVFVSRGFEKALSCQVDADRTYILANPRKLPDVLKMHLAGYCARLRDPTEKALRSNFQIRFDALGGGPGKHVPLFVSPELGASRTTYIS